MGRWRAAPGGLNMVLPIHGEVARRAGGAEHGPPHLWGGGAQRRRGWCWSSPFMGRWRAGPEGLMLVLPIHGEVARSAGGAGAGPPHLWGGGAQRRGADAGPPHLWGGGAQRRRG